MRFTIRFRGAPDGDTTFTTRKDRSCWRIFQAGLCPAVFASIITLYQIAVLVMASPGKSISSAYTSSHQKDSGWYASIVENGYVSTIPPVPQKTQLANVAFFPAFPILAKVIVMFLHLPVRFALALTAQASAFLFWYYLILILRRWQFSHIAIITTALAVLSHPNGFILVVGYSESLFLAMLLGFLYFLEYPGWKTKTLASLHGFVLTATRPVGTLCALWPLVQSIAKKDQKQKSSYGSRLARCRPYWHAAVITLAASGGVIAFFVFCQWKFGRWNLYMQTQHIGWNQTANYIAFFNPATYSFRLPRLRNSISVGHFLLALDFIVLITLEYVEVFQWKNLALERTSRLGYYFCGFTVFYLSVSGTYNTGMRGALRYDLCIHTVIVLGAANVIQVLCRQRIIRPILRYFLLATLWLAIIGGCALQLFYTRVYLAGRWP
ncbi:MAG TPA: hypothetical protein VGO67_03145 [Verrucomicrobiae bacterium]